MASVDFAIYSDSPSPPRGKAHKFTRTAGEAADVYGEKAIAAHRQKPVLQFEEPNKTGKPEAKTMASSKTSVRRSLSLHSPRKVNDHVQEKGASFLRSPADDSGFSETPLKIPKPPVAPDSPAEVGKPRTVQRSMSDSSLDRIRMIEENVDVAIECHRSFTDLSEADKPVGSGATVSDFRFARELQRYYEQKTKNKRLWDRYLELQNLESELKTYVVDLEAEIESYENRNSAVAQVSAEACT